MNAMQRPANISFLNPRENECLELVMQAQELFDLLCKEDPQNSRDSYNFGHYLDAAKYAILVRGCRRLDPDNLMHSYAVDEVSSAPFDAIMARITDRRHTQITEQKNAMMNRMAENGGETNGDTTGGD